jgi:SAM-dependent methyltransferase
MASDASAAGLAFAQFLDSPPGRYAMAWEQAQLDRVVSDIFGYHALQIGLPQFDALRENRMPLRLRMAEAVAPPDAAAPDVAVVAGFDELPFATQSIDLVVLPHTLEFAREPHRVLREVDRVLVPEGQVVIVGFNPASLWGLRQWLVRLGAHPYLPREGQFIHLARIKDWLKLLSFETQLGRFGAYAPWARSEQWLARWSFLEKAGDRWWPVLGSLYMVTAIKRVRGMRLIGPAWKKSEKVANTLAPASTRALLFGEVAPTGRPGSANDPERPADCA